MESEDGRIGPIRLGVLVVVWHPVSQISTQAKRKSTNAFQTQEGEIFGCFPA